MCVRLRLQACLIAIAAVFAVLTGVFFGERVVYAQGGDNDYVDVGLTLEIPKHTSSVTHQLNIAVMNHGSRTAYDVEVVVNVVYPEDFSHFRETPTVPVGSATVENNERTLRWSIPSLGEKQREEVTVAVSNRETASDLPNFDYRKYPHEHSGKVTTSSFESNLHKGNNTARVWSYKYLTTSNSYIQAAGNYSVNVSMDDPSPSTGDTVNFTITAGRENPYGAGFLTPPPIDLEVDIDLTDGLTVTGDPTYGPPSRPASVIYNNGVFDIGTRKEGETEPPMFSVTLPITVASNAVVNKQCLTAKLTGNPPPGVGPHDDNISDNEARLCLGDQPVEPLLSGEVDAFTIYPCVGDTDPPCDSTDDVRVRAVNNSSGKALAPGTAFFHIDSLKARIYDAKTGHSVNDGNTVSWQTAVTAGRPYTSGLSSGVELYYSRTPFVNKTTGWGGVGFGISAKDVDGNTPPPGKVFLRSTSSGNAFRKTESPNFEHLPTTPTGSLPGTSRLNIFLEFEKLGTYKFAWHAAAKRSTVHGSEDCLPNSSDVNQAFCAKETYTFHVGPMADLAVEDGRRPFQKSLPTRAALTIVACQQLAQLLSRSECNRACPPARR